MNKRGLILAAGTACISFFAIITSCDKKVGKLTPSAVTPTLTGCDTVTYTKHIKKIITDNCISCHQDVNPPGGFSLSSYSQVKIYADNGQIKATVLDTPPVPERMPQNTSGLPDAEKALINCWLNNGKKE